jgi:hypothetical protein
VLEAAAFFVLGFVVVTAGTYDAFELVKSVVKGTRDPYVFSRAFSGLVYVIQLPSLLGAPVLVLALAGTIGLSRRFRALPSETQWRIGLAVLLPLALSAMLTLFTLDNFLRHLVPVVPWLCMAAAWALVRAADLLAVRGLRPAFPALVALVMAYQAVFVADGERLFVADPRNEAARWVMANVPEGSPLYWQGHATITQYQMQEFPKFHPPVLVLEMHRANEFVSSMGWKNSFPRDRKHVFDGAR